MALTKKLAIAKGARIAVSGSFEAGAGASAYLPVGVYGGYTYRALLQATMDWVGVTKVVDAVFYFKTSQHYIATSSDPDAIARRLTSAWTEGSAVALSSSNAVRWDNQPGFAGADASANTDISPSTGVWDSINIRDMLENWAPASIAKHDGTPGGGLINYGFHVAHVDAGDVFEMYSDDSSYKPYVLLTYESNRAPTAPTLIYPVGGVHIPEQSPDFQFRHNDPDGDPSNISHLQVATDAGFGTIVADDTAGISVPNGGTIHHPYPPFIGTRGSTYFWRSQTTDPANLQGPFSAGGSFKIDTAPTATKVRPLAGQFAYIWNLADTAVWTSGGAHAKVRFEWNYGDADGGAQTAYRIRIYDAASGGTLVADSGKIASANEFHDANTAHVMGTQRWWTVEVWDDLDISSGESSRTGYSVRWGQAIYEHNAGAGSSSWDFDSGNVTNGAASFAFAPATGSGGVGRGSWLGDIGSVIPNAYLNVLVRLQPNAAAGTSPTLSDMTFTYLGSAATPDRWQLAGTGSALSLDPSVRRFGTQSLRYSSGTFGYVYPFPKSSGDRIPVVPGTTRTFSAYIKTNGVHNGMRLEVLNSDLSSYLATTPYVTDSSSGKDGWVRMQCTYTVPVGVTAVRLQIAQGGAVAGQISWLDGVQDEDRTLASSRKPGFVGNPTVLDSNGIAVDASAGGIFRLRGSTGGSRDTVELGPHALLFTDVELWSPVAETLQVGDGLNAQELIIEGPASGTVGGTVTLGGAGAQSDASLQNVSGNAELSRPLRILSAGDVSPVSTNHGLQIGLSSGNNVRIDDNEIEAITNGVNATLFIQNDGGTTQFGGPLNIQNAPSKRLKYVPLAAMQELFSAATYSADDAANAVTAEATSIPANVAYAAQVQLLMRASAPSSANLVAAYSHADSASANEAVSARDAGVANFYGTNGGIVVLGGLNNRQFRYRRFWGAGTVTWWLRVIGYWTLED